MSDFTGDTPASRQRPEPISVPIESHEPTDQISNPIASQENDAPHISTDFIGMGAWVAPENVTLGPDETSNTFMPTIRDQSDGEPKSTSLGVLSGGRRFRCRTFRVRSRPESELIMLASECAQVLGFSSVEEFLDKSAQKPICPQSQTEWLLEVFGEDKTLRASEVSEQGLATFVSAFSVFCQFGHRIIVNGRPVIDDFLLPEIPDLTTFHERDHHPTVAMGNVTANDLTYDSGQFGSGLLAFSERKSLHGRTPLLSGAEEKHLAQVKRWMSSSSTNPLSLSHSFMDTCYYALEKGHYHVLQLLLDHVKDGPLNSWTSVKFAEQLQTHWSKFGTPGHANSLFFRIMPFFSTTSVDDCSTFRCRDYYKLLYIQWEIPAVVESATEVDSIDFDSIRQFLASFLIIAGSGDTHECSTCLDLMSKQWSWNSIGLSAFNFVVKAAFEWFVYCQDIRSVSKKYGSVRLGLVYSDNDYSSPKALRPSDWQTSAPSLSLYTEIQRSAICFEVPRMSHESMASGLQPIFNAIRWMCSAIRYYVQSERVKSSYGKPLISKSSLKFFEPPKSGNPRIGVLALKPLAAIPLEISKNLCWSKLFRSAVVADTTIVRPWGKGLELPFDIMIRLASVENYYRLHDGIILPGFFTALLPIEIREEDGSIQWHLECVDESDGECLVPHKVAKMIDYEWFRTKEPRVLQMPKCFVGWSRKANVLLGTETLLNRCEPLTWSGLPGCGITLTQAGVEAGAQLGFTAGPINALGQFTNVWAVEENVLRYQPSRNYVSGLNLCRGKVCLLIDSATKQAWLIPSLSLILHLCHTYWRRISAESTPNPIPLAIASANGDQAVIDAIRDAGDIMVAGSTVAQQNESGIDDSERLRQVVLRIMSNMGSFLRTKRTPTKSHIFAQELMDIVMNYENPLKMVPINEGLDAWPDLVPFAERADFVGVCANLGRAIEPISENDISQCTECCSLLPEQKHFLAAHIQCVKSLCERGGFRMDDILFGQCKITEEVAWETRSSPWLTWDQHRSIWNDCHLTHAVLQRTFRSAEGQGRAKNPVMQAVEQEGVVVFGRTEIDHSHFTKTFLNGYFGIS